MSFSLDFITSYDNVLPPRIIVTGPAGIGKTTFAYNAPNPVFIMTEDGSGKLKPKGFPLVESFQDFMEALGTLAEEEHDFETLVVDFIDGIEPLVWQETVQTHAYLEKNEVHTIDDFGWGAGKRAHCLDNWRRVLDCFDYLRKERGMTIILIAHSETREVKDPGTETYEKHYPALNKYACDYLTNWADAVLYARRYVRTKEVAASVKDPKKKRQIALDNEKLDGREMMTDNSPIALAKNRYELPKLIDLSWDAFAEQAGFSSPKE